ncbi:MAG: hypothetical protein Edafosvirus5_62 [Edafosvirus sp.]|uniref:Uncharacterized protein n=1 Tax=Edafosvirus sp. TaxID=2487765 RepID=A0A3G4ZUZ4_9VIRU|nr:MAG: hypothetical protein Edafosvirus5_62 [Edafosvirus sp.]
MARVTESKNSGEIPLNTTEPLSSHEDFLVNCNKKRNLVEGLSAKYILASIIAFSGEDITLVSNFLGAITSKRSEECPDLQYAVERFNKYCKPIICFPPVDIAGIASPEEAIDYILYNILCEQDIRKWFADTQACYSSMEWKVFKKEEIREKLQYPNVRILRISLLLIVGGVKFRFPTALAMIRFMATCLVDVYDSCKEERAEDLGLASKMSWHQLRDRNELVSGDPDEITNQTLVEYFKEFTDLMDEESTSILNQRIDDERTDDFDDWSDDGLTYSNDDINNYYGPNKCCRECLFPRCTRQLVWSK